LIETSLLSKLLTLIQIYPQTFANPLKRSTSKNVNLLTIDSKIPNSFHHLILETM